MAKTHKSIALHDAYIKGLLNGSKKQHRIPIKAKINGVITGQGKDQSHAAELTVIQSHGRYSRTVRHVRQIPCHFEVGQDVYVKEQWSYRFLDEEHSSIEVCYLADGVKRTFNADDLPKDWTPPALSSDTKIVNAVLMPIFLTRLRIKITSMRVEKLEDITEEDSKLEGVAKIPFSDFYKNYLTSYKSISEIENNLNARESFFTLWQSSKSTAFITPNLFVWVLGVENVSP